MKYRLTKLKDTRFEGVHPNGIDEGYVYEGNAVTELEVGKSFIIFQKDGRFLRTSTVTKINSETEFETENSIYKIEEINKQNMENFITGIITKIIIIALSAFIVWLTWNPLITDLIGLRAIGYWDSVVLYILCHTLFKTGTYTHNQKD